MCERSAVRIIPPYGTLVRIIETLETWAKVEAFSKIAWMKQSNLCNERPPERFDITPFVVPAWHPQDFKTAKDYDAVEFGPRGGRFVRTKSGFRRYF